MNNYVVILRLGFPYLEWIPIHCKAFIVMTQKKIDLVMKKGEWEGSWIINLITTVKYIVPASLHLKVVQSPPPPPSPPPPHDVARKPWIHYRVKAGIFVTDAQF
jgi:hypothetical protein